MLRWLQVCLACRGQVEEHGGNCGRGVGHDVLAFTCVGGAQKKGNGRGTAGLGSGKLDRDTIDGLIPRSVVGVMQRAKHVGMQKEL